MKVFRNLYLNLSKYKFLKEFKPLGIKKKRNFLVSLPYEAVDFVKTLPFIQGLRQLGTIVMLIPKNLENIFQSMKPNICKPIFYEGDAKVLTKTHKRLKEQLGEKRFHFLIELNKPANRALPYLTETAKRICFYESNIYPYYNIMIKDGVKSLNAFFNIEKSSPKNLFRFNLSDFKKILKKVKCKKRPLLYSNGEYDKPWTGDKIVIDQSKTLSEQEIYTLLYYCDAYCGQRDALYEFAKIFNKKIIE